MRVADILDASRVTLELGGGTKEEILGELAGPVIESRPDIEHSQLVRVLLTRENASSTAIADGIAIPHGKVPMGEEIVAALGRSASGLDFESVDGQPTKLFFLLVSPETHPSLHLRWLAHIAGLLRNPEFRAKISDASSAEEILASIAEEEARAESS